MTCAVVCLGNELVGDDGIGIRVGTVLGRLALPETVEVLIRPNVGLDLIDLLEEYDEVILVDALRSGRPPGTCVQLDPREAASMANCPSCSHSLGIPEILQLVARMAPDRAERAVKIVGVEAVELERFEVGLSEPVKAALAAAVDAVLVGLGVDDDIRAAGRREAEVESRAVVTVSDVLRR